MMTTTGLLVTIIFVSFIFAADTLEKLEALKKRDRA